MCLYNMYWVFDICVLEKLEYIKFVLMYKYKYLWLLVSFLGCKGCFLEGLYNVRVW